jgi:hypothetical protein
VVALCAEGDNGRVLNDERELMALFQGEELDEVPSLRSAATGKKLIFSRMTAEMLGELVS